MRIIIIIERRIKTKTYRIFSLVLYDNIDNYIDIATKKKYNYFYIKHTKEEDTKKDHYHFVIYTINPTTISKISRDFDIAENYISVTNDIGQRYTLKNTIGYLLHYNMSDKINYKKEDIHTNSNFILNKYYNILTNNNDDERRFLEILAFIEDNHISKMKELSYFCLSINSLDLLKKYQFLFNCLLKENLY